MPASETAPPEDVEPPTRRRPDRATLATLAAAGVVLLSGALLRLYRLGLPIDRDGYDEGVYWQTLRAVSRGEWLYDPVFGSQPPMAQGAILPGYWLFGSSLWSARFSGVLLSLAGIVAGYVIGQHLGGRLGGLALMLLVAVEPHYLQQSRTLQAEIPAVAFAFITVALALAWLDRPAGRTGRLLAVACGVALTISVTGKLIGVTTLAPVVVAMGLHVGSRWREGSRPDGSVLLIPAGAVAATAVIAAPFVGRLDALWDGVVTFHLEAAEFQFPFRARPNGRLIRELLLSWIGAPAAIGAVAALLRRDGRVLVPLGWLGGSALFLYHQDPLFEHHLVTLVPALLTLGAFAFRWPDRTPSPTRAVQAGLAVAAAVAVLGATVNWAGVASDTYAAEDEQATASARTTYRVVDDLRRHTSPDGLVVTDAQFLAALADRDTPANLVDTSAIRILTRYLTSDDLIEQASAPEVEAVLLFPRLLMAELEPFREWVADHFRPVADYGGNRTLWVRR